MELSTPFFCQRRVTKSEVISLLQAMIVEYNSLTKFQNSKKFADFGHADFQTFKGQNMAIFDRRFDLADSIVFFAKLAGVYVEHMRLRLKLVVPE